MDLLDNELQVLKALVVKPLSTEELVATLAPMPEAEVKAILYQLDKKFLATKQPIFGGCRVCACEVKYAWRLTYKGRQCTSQPT